MKLTEDIDDYEDGRRIEELLGEPEEKDEASYENYRRFFRAYVLAPLRIAWGDWRARFGFLTVGFFVFMAFVWEPMYDRAYPNLAPRLIKPFDVYYTQHVFGIPEFTIPGIGWTYTGVWRYPLGTNEMGQPILMQIVNSAPQMLELLVAGAVVSTGLAIVLGITAGYKGGFIDTVLMGITDIVLTIPGLPLIVLLAAIFQPTDPFLLGMLLAIDNWPGLARSLRSQVLTIRNESYVESSRAMGVSDGSILLTDVTPQLMPYVLINAAQAGKKVITEAVALYFLGFLPMSQGNWGRMMDSAYQYGAITNLDIFYLILWPMLVLSLLSFGLVLLSQGLDQVFNPRLRARHLQEDESARLDPSND